MHPIDEHGHFEVHFDSYVSDYYEDPANYFAAYDRLPRVYETAIREDLAELEQIFQVSGTTPCDMLAIAGIAICGLFSMLKMQPQPLNPEECDRSKVKALNGASYLNNYWSCSRVGQGLAVSGSIHWARFVYVEEGLR